MNIKFDELSKIIQEAVNEYGDEALEVVNKATEKYTKQAVKDIKKNAPVQTGAYKKGWTSKVNKGRTNVSGIVYNKDKYQITHLLENGHANRNGGRTPGIQHIGPVNEKIINDFTQEIINNL